MKKAFLIILFLSMLGSLKTQTTEELGYFIYVVESGMHTSIAFPFANDLIDFDTIINRDELRGDGLQFQFIGFGWGDRKYYTNSPDVTAWMAIRAIFWPTEGVMKVDGYTALFESERVVRVPVGREQYFQLYDFIIDSFILDDGKPIKVAEGRSLNDAFYKSKGGYSLFNTSNHWTARGLRRAGLKTPRFPITSGPIMRVLKKNY
jgi:uncharacterized protein (TIGR02117 family)